MGVSLGFEGGGVGRRTYVAIFSQRLRERRGVLRGALTRLWGGSS